MKQIIILLVSFFVFNCGVNTFNTPFIDSKETIQLNFGMPRETILSTLGHPLYVEMGDNKTIVWVYEVRTIEVQSDKDATGAVYPNKNHSSSRHNDPVHRLALKFHKGNLVSWGSHGE